MSDILNEYLQTAPHENGNGNGHSNGKPKAFTLAPAPDEILSSTAPQLRTAARHSDKLSPGSKVLFDELTDLSFLNSVSPQQGVVKMSKKVLAQELHVTIRTITRQARELEGTRFLWTRIVWEYGFEITLWYIRGLANPQAELFHRPNPSYGSARGRRERPVRRGQKGRFAKTPKAPPEGSSAAPAPYGQNCPLDGSTVETAILPPLSAGHGHECPRPTVENVPGQRTQMSPATGQNCPHPTDKNVRWPGTLASVDTGQLRPSAPDAIVPGHGTPVSEFKETPVRESGEGESSNAVNRVNALKGDGRGTPAEALEERGFVSIDTHARAFHSENDFLELCREVMGRWEIDDKPGGPKGNGGLWRLNFRQDKDRAWRVMREAESKKREGFTPDTTWARYCMDLWIAARV